MAAYTVAAKRRRRAGRPAKANVQREPNGKPQRNAKADREAALSVVLGARIRQGLAISLTDAADPRIATALGRAYRSGIIDKRQCDAGELYASAHRRAAGLLGIPSPHPRCPDMQKASRAEINDDDAAKIKRQFWEAHGALGNAGHAAMREVREVAVFDRDCDSPATLQFGLKALAVFFRLPVDVEEKAA